MSSSFGEKEFPKILVAASFAPDVPGGSSWLFYQLLRGLPPEKVAWWTSSGEAPPHARERVGHFASAHIPKRLVPHRRLKELKSLFLENVWVPRAAAHLKAFVREQKPDLLWLLVSHWATPVLHRTVPKLGVPWHTTVHDMLDAEGSVQSLGAARAGRFQGMVHDLYAGAVSRDVISQQIGDELFRATGCQTDLIVRCGAEPEEIDYVRQKPFAAPLDKIRIGYPGTIIAEDTFGRFIAGLKLLRPKLPMPVEVNLFGIHSYRTRPWFDESLIREHGYLSEAELDRRYRECRWGLAIMELDDSNPRYSRFSFPCKVTRSLAAGLPIISMGHPACTLTQFMKGHQLGPVITSPEPEQIAAQLLPALSDFQESPELRSEILRCTEAEFNAELNRKKLHALFTRR